MAAASMYSYHGHCHCNTVKFTFSLPQPLYAPESDPNAERWTAIHCNCSICTRNGYVLVHPRMEDVKFVEGESKLGEYRFGSKAKPHLFCTECGSSLAIKQPKGTRRDGEARYAINLRMVSGIDLATLKIKEVDGWAILQPAYEFAG